MKTDHSKCAEKVIKEHSNENTEYIRFDLHTITTIGTNKKNMSGQRCWVKEKSKKNELKSFIRHDYCPWCGKKY